MGNPDLSSGDGGARKPADARRGFVVFPVGSLSLRSRRRGAGWLGDWWIVLAAVIVAALVIAVALLAR